MDNMPAITPFNSKVEREITVKASNQHLIPTNKSDFSALDYITTPTKMNFTIVYSYVVSLPDFETAIMKTLNRFPEAAGHFVFDTSHNSHFNLVNNGCQLVLLESANISLDELKATNFNYDQMLSHFYVNSLLLNIQYMMHVTVQYLKGDSGMVVHFAFNHLLCDATGYYTLTEDICSNLRNKDNVESQNCAEIIHGQRVKCSLPSGREPSCEHPELTSEGLNAELKQKLFQIKIKEMRQNPPKSVRLSLTGESMQQLKEDVYKNQHQVSQTTSKPYNPSSNDCLVSVLWKVYVATQTQDSLKNPKSFSTIQVACNCRAKREPALPNNFFGNYSLTPLHTTETEALLEESDLETAYRIRKMVSSVDGNFVQSTIDYIHKNERAQRKWDAPNPFIVTNWNGMVDWFQGTDMGKRKPEKMLFLSKTMATFCVVLQGSTNMKDIDITLGGSPNHMEKFVQSDIVRKYFIVN